MTHDANHTDAGHEGAAVVSSKPNELAIAVERVTAIVMDRSFRGSEVVLGINQNRATIDDLRLILSRLVSQEETIRADGEALKPFARYLDVIETIGGNTPRTGAYCSVSSSSMGDTAITIEDMQEARARLAARQEG